MGGQALLNWWPVLALAAGIGSIPLMVGWMLNRRMRDPEWRARRRAALNQRLDALDVAANHVADQLLELEVLDAESDARPVLPEHHRHAIDFQRGFAAARSAPVRNLPEDLSVDPPEQPKVVLDMMEPPWLGCTLPSPGWWCSREKGHDGPCAARRGAPETNEVLP